MPEDESVNTAAQEYFCRLTTAGAALEAQAKAEGKPVVLTQVAVGDGAGVVPVPEATATALVHEVLRRQIDGRKQDPEDPNIAWLHVVIPADEGGFWIREFGVYAAPLAEEGEPVLYAYGNHAPYYKQKAAQGQATTHELAVPVVLSGTAEVEISVKDAGYASQLALDDLEALVMADRKRLWENDGEGPGVLGDVLPVATEEAPGIVQPDGVTLTVDEEGLISALGGNLLLNAEEWITASGEWVAELSGWHEIHVWHGGEGGYWNTSNGNGHGGGGYAPLRYMVYFTAGETVAVSIGAGGLGQVGTNLSAGGGKTTFGDLPTVADAPKAYIPPNPYLKAGLTTSASTYLSGMGQGAGKYGSSPNAAVFYGAGGAVTGATTAANCAAANGYQGAVLVRFYDPSKAAGPQAAPALFATRAMRRAVQLAVVNLYDPQTGQGSVWREEDAEAKLAEGMITEAEWLEICADRAAEERAAWLANPDTGAERFEMLRAARDARLAATDYLVAPDYPLSEAQRAAVTAYRQALRDLPAQEGAPWDGGGELTPWPNMPALTAGGEA